MKMLFNHGLSIPELFSNTPPKVSIRKWKWMIKRYGYSYSADEAISMPFKYFMYVMFNKILDEKKRFIIPGVTGAYIDFECIKDECFLAARQNSAFPDIDFVNSDFCAYRLAYFFEGKNYQKKLTVYLGSSLKKKLIDKTNAGEKMYSVADLTFKDIFPIVCKRFDEIPVPEVRRILMHGFRRMHFAIRVGCFITIKVEALGNCFVHIGQISLKEKKYLWLYTKKRNKKLRVLYSWNGTQFDGNYYIGLHQDEMLEWVKWNKNHKTTVTFKETVPKKILKELFYKYSKVHIFRIKLDEFKGYSFWADEIRAKDVKYLGEVNKLVYTPMEKSWQEIKKEYAAK